MLEVIVIEVKKLAPTATRPTRFRVSKVGSSPKEYSYDFTKESRLNSVKSYLTETYPLAIFEILFTGETQKGWVYGVKALKYEEIQNYVLNSKSLESILLPAKKVSND